LPVKNRRSPFEGRTFIPRAVTRPRAEVQRLVILLIAIGTLALSLRLAQAAETTPATDSQRITRMMKAQFDRPGQPLTVDPVSIEGPFAVAGWIQGDAGGRALLQRAGNQWEIVLCSGDGLLQAATLTGAGMSGEAASRLLVRVREGEARLAPAQRAKLGSFEGLVRMRAEGHHDAHDAHGKAAPVAAATGISVTHAWIRATPPGLNMSAAYMAITNLGTRAEVLIGASSPRAAGVKIHRTSMEGGMSRMRPAGEIPIAPGATIQIEPRGLHMMLVGLDGPLVEGTSMPLTLRLRNAGDLNVQLAIRPLVDAPMHSTH
jgi:copper(I)-binding protein